MFPNDFTGVNMSYKFNDILPDLVNTISIILKSKTYLIKGGQAVAHHLKSDGHDIDSRFSRDLDVSIKDESFPIALDQFKIQMIELFNQTTSSELFIKDIDIVKMPDDPNAYFGIRLNMFFGEKTRTGAIGKKRYFSDIESLKVVIDISCGQFISPKYCKKEGIIKYATFPLIIAEKFRALCCHSFDPELNPLPRSKDFFDIFLIFNLIYQRKPDKRILMNLKTASEKCFAIKNMPLSLLQTLYTDEEKEFHRTNFEAQVLDTINPSSKYKKTSFDQAYNDTMELLDLMMGS